MGHVESPFFAHWIVGHEGGNGLQELLVAHGLSATVDVQDILHATQALRNLKGTLQISDQNPWGC